jgi:hypothetical protein
MFACVCDVWYVDGDGCAVVPVLKCRLSFLYSQDSRSVIGDQRLYFPLLSLLSFLPPFRSSVLLQQLLIYSVKSNPKMPFPLNSLADFEINTPTLKGKRKRAVSAEAPRRMSKVEWDGWESRRVERVDREEF